MSCSRTKYVKENDLYLILSRTKTPEVFTEDQSNFLEAVKKILLDYVLESDQDGDDEHGDAERGTCSWLRRHHHQQQRQQPNKS